MKYALLVLLITFTLAGCAGTMKTTAPDGTVTETPEAVAVMQAAADIEKSRQEKKSNPILSVDQLSGLSASAQAEYMKALPTLVLAGVVNNLTGGNESGGEAKAYFNAQAVKYKVVGGATQTIGGYGLAAYGIKSLNDFMTSAFSGAGDTFNTTANGNTINAGAGAASEFGAAPGGNATVNFGGLQATDGSTLVKGNGNTPYFLTDSNYQNNEKGTIGDGDLNDQQDGQGATQDGIF